MSEFLRPKEPTLGSFDIGAKSAPREYNHNEDSAFILRRKGAVGVFDGMGGHTGGMRASQIARDTVVSLLETLPDGLTARQISTTLEKVLSEAHAAILREGQVQPDLKGMGTTATVVIIVNTDTVGGRVQEAVVANIGNSRAYVLRAGNIIDLEQVTLDDSLLRNDYGETEARRVQKEVGNADNPNRVNPGHIKRQHIITQALGLPSIKPRLEIATVNPGDQLIVTSDGIHDNLTDREIAAFVAISKTPQIAAERLVEKAQERSRDRRHPRAKQDDMTAVVITLAGNPGRARTIGEAQTFDDLYGVLQGMDSLRGSQMEYSAGDLRRLIQDVRNGKRSINYITRTGDLRIKVLELLDREQRRRR